MISETLKMISETLTITIIVSHTYSYLVPVSPGLHFIFTVNTRCGLAEQNN